MSEKFLMALPWFADSYSHFGPVYSKDEALEAVMEDWAILSALNESKISKKNLPQIEQFESKRLWKMRINTGLYFLDLPAMDTSESKIAFQSWFKNSTR